MQSAPRLTASGIAFRNLNKNGRLDPYEDSRRPIDERVEDLLSQMTLEEKAGLMFHRRRMYRTIRRTRCFRLGMG